MKHINIEQRVLAYYNMWPRFRGYSTILLFLASMSVSVTMSRQKYALGFWLSAKSNLVELNHFWECGPTVKAWGLHSTFSAGSPIRLRLVDIYQLWRVALRVGEDDPQTDFWLSMWGVSTTRSCTLYRTRQQHNNKAGSGWAGHVIRIKDRGRLRLGWCDSINKNVESIRVPDCRTHAMQRNH